MSDGKKLRLDLWMVAQELAASREKAQALIMAGEVLVNGQKAVKPGQLVGADARVEVLERPRFVSRGGLKLEAALLRFEVNPQGMLCADFGASTGGFTDCLLQMGAARVHAIDTGSGQFDWKLRTDPRVVLYENCNARYLEAATLGEVIDLAVCDVSFISVTLILPAILRVLDPVTGRLVILVKPQFEVGKGQVGKGGIVRDPALHQAACDKVRTCVEESGFTTSIMDSPITGAEGNREFLLYGHR